MGAKPGQSRKSGRQRLALLVFAALFVVLFAGYAIAQGLGHPSVPSGDAAIVQHVPDDIGTISDLELKRSIVRSAAGKVPPKGTKKYEETLSKAMSEILDEIWIQGEAEELGITITPKQIAIKLAEIKKENFKTEAEFQKFIKSSELTPEDVNNRVKLQLLGTQIQEQVAKEAPPASDSQVSAYYDTAKATQFTKAESRDIRFVVNKDKAKAEQAKALLEKSDSPASWKKATAKFSSDPTSKATGGLQKEITEEGLKEPIKAAMFGSPTGEVVGPIDYEGSFYVIEIEKLNPEKVQTLAEVSAQIKSQLTQQLAQEVVGEFITNFQSKWRSRTFCSDDALMERCANYVGSGHPASAPPACYEADPKGGTPAECPAPVAQVAPSLPGSVTVLEPQGKRLPQRPRPEGLKESAEEGLTLPEGVAPPTGE